ncbi:MAG: hypothetical protein KDK28_14530 [Maritimibacter sp.]|nr:hypothetical protein [Maritimibacter sp.]
MTYQNLILGISIYLLLWEHLPHWGRWFKRLIAALPGPLQTLYEQWRCPYCVGFWIGLGLHAVTGTWLFPAFAQISADWGPLGGVLGWFFDGLAFAVLNKTGVIAINALSYPALLGMAKKTGDVRRSLRRARRAADRIPGARSHRPDGAASGRPPVG